MHRKKRGLYLLGPFMILIIAFYSAIHYDKFSVQPALNGTGQPMERAFLASGAIFQEANVQGFAQVSETFMSEAELFALGEKSAQSLGPEDLQVQEKIFHDGFHSLKLAGLIEGSVSGEIALQSLTTGGDVGETILIIHLVDDRGAEFLNLAGENIVSTFRLLGQEPSLSRLLLGFYQGKLDGKGQRRIMEKMFQTVDGRMLEEAEEENYLSKTGYVPGLSEEIAVGRKKINFQAAMSYDELGDRTYLYLGSPVINTDY